MLSDDEKWLKANFGGVHDVAFPQQEAAPTDLGKV
jgi:hypothetical protein